MEINKFHYKQLTERKRMYIDATTLKIREKLNVAFKNPTAEDDMTGIFGKFNKFDKMYKVKYIYTRNKQLQPMTFDRYHYLVDVGEDENGSYIEYAMVYDKLYDPLIRIVYIIAVFAVLAYLLYAYKLGAMSIFSAGVLGVIVVASIVLVLKKSKESKEECLKAEKLFKNLISDIDFS
ncbi:MAG: hypothetical protein IJA43_06975 [Clostridia bacterium]|nr:hypothetical protein [Clostridia bacterium]